MKLLNMKNVIISLVFGTIILAASCLKKQNLEEEIFSSAVPPEEIASALGEGFGSINYSDIKVNEKSSLVLTQSIQDGSAIPIEQQDITISYIDNSATALELKLLAKIFTPSLGADVAPTEWNPVFTKYGGFALATNSTTSGPLYMFQTFQNLALGSCYDDGNYPESCHNLVVTNINYRVPSSAAYQHTCTDIYNCYIPAKKVEFDMIRKYEFESDGKPRRIHHTMILSQHVPFLSRVLSYCTRALYDIEGVPQKILADLCYNVNNYTFGQ